MAIILAEITDSNTAIKYGVNLNHIVYIKKNGTDYEIYFTQVEVGVESGEDNKNLMVTLNSVDYRAWMIEVQLKNFFVHQPRQDRV